MSTRRTRSSPLLQPLAILAVAVASLVVAGCNGGRDPNDALLSVAEAPEPPPQRTVPLDDRLASRAGQIVHETAAQPDPLRRANAMEAAEHLPHPEAAELVTSGLDDEDPRVRFAAAMTAGKLRLQEARPKLEAMAEGQSPNGRVAAVYALHRLGDSSRSQRLVDYAQSTDALVRANAALAIGLLGEPTGVAVLQTMRQDPDQNVRFNVSEALWRLGSEEGYEALLAASISGYSDDRVLGTLALAAPGHRQAFPALEGKLTDEYVEVQLAAARGLGMLGSDRGYAVAAAHVDARPSASEPAGAAARRRALAALALGEIGRLDAQPHLRPLLEDADPYVRLSAATAMLKLVESNEATAAGAAVK